MEVFLERLTSPSLPAGIAASKDRSGISFVLARTGDRRHAAERTVHGGIA